MSLYYRSRAKKICISFDWHHDARHRNMLKAWVANSKNPVTFTDLTPGAINTDDVGRVKAVLTTQIRASTHMLVLVGAYANTKHKDAAKIDDHNWIWWEINKAKAEGKGLIGVKIDSSYKSPLPLLNSDATWAMSFAQDAILKAIGQA